MLATPIVISPEERYLCGHYLAYLLGGSRRRGIFLRRPLDARNADRARLLLAMTWLSCVEPTQEAIERASVLLEDRPDVRAALSPVVVIKYLASRDTPAKRKRFRQVRKRLQEASAYARKAMLDAKGVLNPGMMPRTLDDLAMIAPPRDTLDAHRVSLWNRVAEVWRQEDDFRQAVLRYATRSDHLDTVSADLWPEVVYPLIERAHWQRTFRPRHEAIWDYVVGKLLHVPVPGVRLDRMMVIAIPLEVAEQLDEDLFAFVDDPRLDEDEASPSESPSGPPSGVRSTSGARSPETSRRATTTPRASRRWSPSPRPTRSCSPRTASATCGKRRWTRRTTPRGPACFTGPSPSGRTSSRSSRRAGAGRPSGRYCRVCPGKADRDLHPPALARDSASRTVIAIWVYQDASMAVVHLDFQSKERYILWHAPDAHQFNFDYLEELRHQTVHLEPGGSRPARPDPLQEVTVQSPVWPEFGLRTAALR